MRSHLVLIMSVATIFGASPIDVPAQASCSQREWRLLFDYDAHLMRAYDALDWPRYAALQRQLLAQLSRGCLAMPSGPGRRFKSSKQRACAACRRR